MPSLEEIFGSEGNYNPTPTDVPSLEEIFGTPEQIDDELEPGFFEKNTGRLTGSIVGGIKGYEKTPGPWQAKLIGGAVGAGFGAFTGDLAQQEYQKAVDSTLAPKTYKEQFERALIAGGEEALWELAGGAFFKGGSEVWKFIRPKKIEGIDEIQEQIAKHGGSLTASQMTSNRLIETIEGLVEASWGGLTMQEARTINKQAIREYATAYINHFNLTSAKILDDEGIGTLFLNGLEVGNKIHSKVGGKLYTDLDTLYKPLIKKKLVATEVSTGILDATGKMLNKKTTQLVEEEVLPVSTKALKEFAKKELAKTSGTKHRALGSWSKSELEGILKFDDTISFAEAQAYRSKLLAEGRISKNKAGVKLGQGGDSSMIGSLSSKADEMIKQGALDTKNPEFIAAWREANTFWKEGKEAFNNKFMVKLGQKNASAIGKKLYNSDVEDIRLAKAALRKAAQLSKGTKDEFKFGDVWIDMQQGYMQKIVADTIIPASKNNVDAISLGKLDDWLKPHSDKNKKLMAAFTKEQRDGLQTFFKSVQSMQKLPRSPGTFMVTVGQAGLIFNTIQGSIPAMQFAGDLAAYTIGPSVLSKLLTHPTWAKRIAGVIRMSGRPRLGTAATASVLKLIAAVQEIELLGER